MPGSNYDRDLSVKEGFVLKKFLVKWEKMCIRDSIIVMCEGKVTGNIDISEATQEHIMDKATRNID